VRAVVERGVSTMRAQLVARFGTHGEDGCFNTNDELREVLKRPDGRQYHRESIGRVRRQGALEGLWSHRRIPPGRKPNKLAERRTSHGTALNVLNWSGLFRRRPPLRGEQRKVAAELRRECNAASTPRPRRAFIPFTPPPGLVEHMERTGRDVDRSEKPGRDGREGVSDAELLEFIAGAKAAMDPGATGPPE
jgi:hypothetical protein